MPELDFYLVEEEELELVQFILDNNAWFVPDLKYDAPEYFRITSLVEFKKVRKAKRHFFVLSSAYLKSPLKLRRVEKGRAGFYRIEHRVGGPTIDFLGSGTLDRGPTRLIVAGSVSHYPSYYDSLANILVHPPEGLKALYTAIVKRIKRTCFPVRGKSRKYWVGPRAALASASGAIRVGLDPETSSPPLQKP
jgi:hypothetical protein